MTDKQIIDEMTERIGFDVQQCGYLKIIKDALNYPEIGGTFTAFECNLYSRDCDCIERCRYKQLLRKEQECKNNKIAHQMELDIYNQECLNLQEELKAKEQECDGLKIMLKDLSYEAQKLCYQIEEQTKQLEPFKDEYFKGLDNVVIAKLAKKSIRITAENSKLEQTLTDIKEIAEVEIECKTYEIENDCFNETRCKALNEHIDFIKQILQKISEYEVKNE